MTIFNIGDKVKCIRGAVHHDFRLVSGQIYTVTGIAGISDDMIYVNGYKNWFFAINRFEKVSDNVNGIIELNGVKYQVENIPGKGECLVPYIEPAKTVRQMLGAIYEYDSKYDRDKRKFILQRSGNGDFGLTALDSNSIYTGVGFFKSGNEKIQDKFTLGETGQKFVKIADSLSEAIQKGLIK